ncbi:MAG TPA: hypothetical protein DEA96_02755 [Leptospiraceae bacterium]|nr:hypothetical protein [Spirochaetaceae bacterium]HBS03857.1 hypothetical protein [Leptospiraceae bacterium]|tara:strand:+ start:99480 stop:100697 length:1218 start_codon:yes stop_codon:yes gene_type:complete
MSSRKPDILLIERGLLEHRPLSRFQSIFRFRSGLFSEWERIRLEFPSSRLLYYHPDPELEGIFARSLGATALQSLASDEPLHLAADDRGRPEKEIQILSQKPGIEIRTSSRLSLFRILDDLDGSIQQDLDLIGRARDTEAVADIELARWQWLTGPYHALSGVSVLGNPGNLMVHPSCEIGPGVVLDAREGPIILDEDVRISAFSFLEGPLYAGPGCRLDNLRLTGGNLLGAGCRLGGEVENSILGDYTNKHHEGFIGHSVIGSWVNLGALTTTSDLKNNYGEIRLKLPVDQFPDYDSEIVEVSTGRIKFGSILGDCVKTAIGTMINTGTVLDAGSNVFGGHPPKYLYPLSWGLTGRRYQTERFLADCEKIFARRGQSPDKEMPTLVHRLVSGKHPENMDFLGDGI